MLIKIVYHKHTQDLMLPITEIYLKYYNTIKDTITLICFMYFDI